jgi:hypothetical protein
MDDSDGPASGTSSRLHSPAPGDVAGAPGIRSLRRQGAQIMTVVVQTTQARRHPDRQIRTNRGIWGPARAIAAIVIGYLRNAGGMRSSGRNAGGMRSSGRNAECEFRAECGDKAASRLPAWQTGQTAHPQVPAGATLIIV